MVKMMRFVRGLGYFAVPSGKKGYCVRLLCPPGNIECFQQSHGYCTCLVHNRYFIHWILTRLFGSVFVCSTCANIGQTDS